MRNAKPRVPYSSNCAPHGEARQGALQHTVAIRWRRNTHKYIIESSLMVSTVIHLVCTYFVYLVICITFIFKWVHIASRTHNTDQLYDRTASWDRWQGGGWKMQRECHYILVCFYYLYTLTHTYQAKAQEEEHTKKSVLYVLQLNFYEEKFNGKIQFQTRKVHLFVAYACVVCVFVCMFAFGCG